MRFAVAMFFLLCWFPSSFSTAQAQENKDRFAESLERTKERIQEKRRLYKHQFNIQYAKKPNADERRISLDIFWPRQADNPTPVVIFVHGGAWQFGDKRLINQKQEWLAKNGIALVSVNYRFFPEVDFEQQAADVADAFAWVKQNSRQYNIDKQKIFLMGHSAGAHLVALVATDPGYLAKYAIKTHELKGVIPIDGGGLDVALQIEIAESPTNLRTYEKIFGTDPERHKLASPVHHLKSGSQYAPFFVAYVPTRKSTPTQAKNFVKKLQSVGGSGEAYGAKGKTHMTINRELGIDGDETAAKIMEFIKFNCAAGQEKQPANVFDEITLHKSGGFAGINIIHTISPDGEIESNKKQGRQISDKKLRQLKQLIANTDWSQIPKSVRNADNVADDFHWSITIKTEQATYRFEIDGLQLKNHTELLGLVRMLE